MPRVTISKAALDKLNADPLLGHWKRDARRLRMPLLHYYRRLTSTARDGTVTEHGDGFILTFVDPDAETQPHVAGYETVALGDGHAILVEIQTCFAPGAFTIGLCKGRFTYEPYLGL